MEGVKSKAARPTQIAYTFSVVDVYNFMNAKKSPLVWIGMTRLLGMERWIIGF